MSEGETSALADTDGPAREPGRLLFELALTVVGLAALGTRPDLLLRPWPLQGTLIAAAGLAVAMVMHARVGRGAPPHAVTIDPTPVFLVYTCVALPPLASVALVLAAHAAAHIVDGGTSWRPRLDMALQTTPAYAVAAVTAHAASDAGAGWTTTSLVAAATYFAVNISALLAYARLRWARPLRWVLEHASLWAIDVSTVALGFLTAAACRDEAWPALAAVPVCALCQYAFMRPHIELQLNIDPKTALANAKGVSEAGEALVLATARAGLPLAAVMLDIDHFKVVNDTYGHPAGDQVIVEIAARLRATLRADAVIGRIGGEEYLVLLPGADLPAAVRTAERVRAAVESAPVQTQRGEVAVTVSAGCAALTARPAVRRPSADGLLALLTSDADLELYRAKAAGRNRVMPTTTDRAGVAGASI
jgi:diguanylate cyclase (GGDEF)-like protein